MSMSRGWLVGVFCLFLFLLFGVVSVFGHDVGGPIDVRVSLSFDDGVNLVPVNVSACIGSVYFVEGSDLLLRDVSLSVSGSGLHNFTFVPMSLGSYVVSVSCSYNNESAVYHEEILVSEVVGGGGTAGVLNFDAKVFVS